jgi:Phytanoyl-CoA dioxygenase (PhyH)
MIRVLAALRVLGLTSRSLVLLPFGIAVYLCTGRTPEFAHRALIWLFCISQGRCNDLLSRVVSVARPKIIIDTPVGVLGDMRGSKLRDNLSKLRSDGFVVFERALPSDVCERLLGFALGTRAQIRRSEGQEVSGRASAVIFDPRAPLAVRYDYSASDLLDNSDVQSLLADQSILNLAQQYLGCQPLADVITMWWHTNYHSQPDAQAAQFFHFDMDRIKWLKVFVYLTDVGPDNGPHSFVGGSQRTGAIPPALLLRGYKRLTDQEVHGVYGANNCLEFSAPRGSIIVEDTRGLHKGANVRGEPRLVLQLQFSNCLFGANYPRSTITRVNDPSLREMLTRAPAVYSQYT